MGDAFIYWVIFFLVVPLLVWIYIRKKSERESEEAQWILTSHDLGSPTDYQGDHSLVGHRAGESLALSSLDPQEEFENARTWAILGFVCAGLLAGLLVVDLWKNLFWAAAAIVTFGHAGASASRYLLAFRIFIAALGLATFLVARRLRARRPRPRMVIIDGRRGRITVAQFQAGGHQDIYQVGESSAVLMKESLSRSDSTAFTWSIQFLGRRKPVVLTVSTGDRDREQAFRNAASLAKEIATILRTPIRVQRLLISAARPT